MKIKTVLKTLPIFAASALCFNANAGVIATSYLEINELIIQIDTDGDDSADAVTVTDYVTINNGSRLGNTNANFNGVSVGDSATVSTATGTADANLVCVGPDCGTLGLSNNGQTADLGNLVYSDASNYAVSDEFVTGSALNATGARGFTYGDVGIATSNNVGSASSAIFNNINASITLTVLNDIQIQFVSFYDLFLDAFVSADVIANPALTANAAAEASFELNLESSGANPGTVTGDLGGITFSDFADGFGDFNAPLTANNQAFASNWVTVTAGDYRLRINQDSDVQADLIPEPGILALFGLGLVGFGVRSRRKS